MPSLADMRCLIIDMDGVLWHGTQPLPGLIEFFDALRRLEFGFVLATNNASLTPEQYVNKLAAMGVTVSRDEVLTSAQAAGMFLATIAPRGAQVYAIGEDGVRQAMEENGFRLSQNGADFVVVGMDRAINWEKLAQATLNIRAGARFIGTNPDTTFPSERGIVHGNGAILAALTAATEVSPVIIGKPEPLMYQLAMNKLGADKTETAAVGDRLGTDILGAVRAGIPSALVLTGVSTEAELQASDFKPTWVFAGLPGLTRALGKGRGMGDWQLVAGDW